MNNALDRTCESIIIVAAARQLDMANKRRNCFLVRGTRFASRPLKPPFLTPPQGCQSKNCDEDAEDNTLLCKKHRKEGAILTKVLERLCEHRPYVKRLAEHGVKIPSLDHVFTSAKERSEHSDSDESDKSEVADDSDDDESSSSEEVKVVKCSAKNKVISSSGG